VSLVSVCIPAYNQTVFLKKTLDSLRSQTFKDFEVVITDDSSTNEVQLLVEKYRNDLSINYHKNPKSLGSPTNWNKSLDLAKGGLIKIIHHDDWLAWPESLQKFVDVFKNEKVSFAFCTTEILNVKDNTVSYNRPEKEFLENLKKDPRFLFNYNKIGSPTATMFRKTNLRFDEKVKYLVDVDFYIRMLSTGAGFVYIDEPLIVNTSNNTEQVTAASLNKETQVGEYSYLYNKVYKNAIPNSALSRFFIDLFRRYKVKSLAEIESWGGTAPEPKWYFKWLVFKSRF